jgi:hypothetical protein
VQQRRVDGEPKRTSQRPVVEVAAPTRTFRVALGAGHEILTTAPVKHNRRPQPATTSPLAALALNGVAALVALLAALVAGRRSRRAPDTGAQVFHLPRLQPARHAA